LQATVVRSRFKFGGAHPRPRCFIDTAISAPSTATDYYFINTIHETGGAVHGSAEYFPAVTNAMASDLFDLSGEVAAVVGGTGALGGAMAAALASCGARVAVVGRNAQRGAERVRSIESAGGTAMFAAADALSRDSLSEAREKIAAQLGAVSVLVNAAGGNRPDATLPPGSNFCDLPLEGWETVFDLNLVGGVLLPTQVFGQAMLDAGRGSVINIASMAGMIPLSRVVAYSAAKAAVLNLTKLLGREWAARGVRVNAISPGFFPAEQNRALLFKDDGTYTERGGQIIGHTPMARFGEAHELGGAVVWLAAAKASAFVTGQNIVVDGGFSSTTI
jgi:NAD(P)-dependent dehydrogenase (short-subunit alcohol dehydrogenase family)